MKPEKKIMCRAKLDENGSEINNPTPLFVRTDVDRRLSLPEQIQRMISVQLSQRAECMDQETFEEANDFNVEDPFFDDVNNDTIYTVMEDVEPVQPSPLPTGAAIAESDTESPKGDKSEGEEGAPEDAG